MDKKIDISAADLKMVCEILSRIIPDKTKVWVFGSRVKGTAKKFSDLDLALESADGSKIDQTIIYELRSDFEDSDLPWMVDVLDLNSIDVGFRKVVDQDKVLLEL